MVALGVEPVVSSDDWPTVTVVVPVHGDRGQIALTARALADQDYPGRVEVVVVDNGDNEGLASSMAAVSSAVIVAEPTPGSYAARNTGVRSSEGEVLAFTDGDCLPRYDWLREGVSALLSQDGPTFVGGAINVFSADPSRPTLAEVWDCVNGLRQDRYVQQHGWAATANMLTTRETHVGVGPFDESLHSGGDREWGERSVRDGVRAVYAPNAVVDHPARSSMGELHRKVRRVTQGSVALRRDRGLPAFDRGELWGSLRPNVRSILRKSSAVSSGWTIQRARFVMACLWLQYYFLAARLFFLTRDR